MLPVPIVTAVLLGQVIFIKISLKFIQELPASLAPELKLIVCVEPSTQAPALALVQVVLDGQELTATPAGKK